MASWMIHLRIADQLLDQLDVQPTEFVVGNIATDSGVPNEDWSIFTPSYSISHFKDEKGNINADHYAAQYFAAEQQRAYDHKQFSFYLGYLTHLLTDQLWGSKIAKPSFSRYRDPSTGKCPIVDKIKDDWYDLDYLYLQNNPDFRAFRIYDNAAGFLNIYLDFFSADAFDNRRQYITWFYRQPNDHLHRDYPYLSARQADAFVEEASAEILSLLKSKYFV